MRELLANGSNDSFLVHMLAGAILSADVAADPPLHKELRALRRRIDLNSPVVRARDARWHDEIRHFARDIRKQLSPRARRL
jgi:hypothetical protein